MVVSQLNSALAVSGLQIMHSLEQGMQGGGGLVARASVSPTKQVRRGVPSCMPRSELTRLSLAPVAVVGDRT